MAQFYKGLKPKIKKIMAVTTFLNTWEDLIANISRLDDNFRRYYYLIILHRAILAIASYLNYIIVQFWLENKVASGYPSAVVSYTCK